MDAGQVFIVGRLALTFGIRIGLPLLDLWLLGQEQQRANEEPDA